MLDLLVPAVAAAVFLLVTSRIREPTRLRVHAVIVAGASGVYLNAGLGTWEILYAVAALAVAYRALGSYRWVGVAWLMHSAWDAVHHLQGYELLDVVPQSSFGCAICDAVLGVYFLYLSARRAG